MFIKSEYAKTQQAGNGISRKILAHGGKIMVAEVSFEQGAVAESHRHIHEQACYIINGSFEFTIDGGTKIIVSGDSVYIPSNVEHSVKALESGLIIDIFTPQREDFLLN
jgi:quercetin dioxygenase-like cupin family protein